MTKKVTKTPTALNIMSPVMGSILKPPGYVATESGEFK